MFRTFHPFQLLQPFRTAISRSIAAILRTADFYAPLTTSLADEAGGAVATFTRGTTASVWVNDGANGLILRTAQIGEARFEGARRVGNLLANTTTLATQSVTVVSGNTYTFSFYGTGSVVLSGGYSGSLAGAGASNRVQSTFASSSTALTLTVTGSVTSAQLENVTGQAVQTASEYVSNGVLSYPYHGAGVDGVKYFDTLLDGSKIPAAMLKGVQIEGTSRTNYLLNSAVLATQNVTVTVRSYCLSFWGTGTVTLSGAYSGSLVGTGASNRVYFAFTPTAGTLTLTVSGPCTNANLEGGSTIPSSYIPTTSATVTRNADSLTYAYAHPAGQPGSFLCDLMIPYAVPSEAYPGVQMDDDSNNNTIGFFLHPVGSVRQYSRFASANQVVRDCGAITSGTLLKLAQSFQTNRFIAAKDGVLGAADTSCSVPAITRINLSSCNGHQFNGYVSNARAFKSRTLTDKQLEDATK